MEGFADHEEALEADDARKPRARADEDVDKKVMHVHVGQTYLFPLAGVQRVNLARQEQSGQGTG